MSETLFAHPEWLASVSIACSTALACVAFARVRQRARRQRLGARTQPTITLARDVALLIALTATGLALLGPRFGETLVRVPGTGADVVLLIDVSRSMTASDVAPTRLGAAQAAATEVLARLSPEDRAALVIFASRGVVLAPLTPDFEALAEMIAVLDAKLIEPAGSNLTAGVDSAVEVFEIGSERSRSVFLLSDGEDPRTRGTLGTDVARRADATIVAAGFGADAGANVPGLNAPLRDADGAPVVSRRDMRRLTRLAEATGGAAFAADAQGTFDSRAAVALIRAEAAQRKGQWVERPVPAVIVEPLALLAVLLLIGEAVTRRRLHFGAKPFALALVGGWLIAAAPAGEHAPTAADPREFSADPVELIHYGLERIEARDSSAGMRALQAAALSTNDPALAGLAWYDLGVAALEMGDLERARDAFFDALALTPFDREARFNLEWTLEALSDQPAELELPVPPTPSQQPEPPSEEDPEKTPAAEPDEPTHMDAAEKRRILLQVHDDLRRALLAAAQADAPKSRHTRTAW